MARPYLCTGVTHTVVGSLCVAAGVTFAALLTAYPGDGSSSSGADSSENATVDEPTNVMAVFRNRNMVWAGFLACSKIWCGVWFVVTGAVGVSVQQKGSILESAYLALSILNVVLWAPIVMAVNGFIAYLSVFFIFLLVTSSFYWLLLFPIIGVLFGVIEFILSIVSSSMVCCYAPELTPENYLEPSILEDEIKGSA